MPIEVIVNPKQSLDSFVGVDYVVFEAFSAQMHVGKEAEQRAIVGQRAVNFDAVVVRVRRNRNGVVVVGEL